MVKEESFEMDDVEQGPSNSLEASLLRSKFDNLASKKGSLNLGKKKKWALVVGLTVSLWLIGTMLYLNGGADAVIDYYKNQVGSTGPQDPEVNGEDTIDEPADEGAEEAAGDSEELNDATDNISDGTSTDKSDEKVADSDTTNKVDTQEKQPITISDLRSGRLSVYSVHVDFLNPPGQIENDEGLYYYADRSGVAAFKSSNTGWTKKLFDSFTFTYGDVEYHVMKFTPNYDLTWAIISTNLAKKFRHSSLGYYWLYNIESKRIIPLTFGDDESLVKLSYATWSPKYNYISFVKDNNLYVKSLEASIQQVTTDGNEKLLNARTDWVYEEEVLAEDKALWWSPDETTLVFMKTSDEGIPEYNIDFYVQGPGGATKYPISEKIAYPKPGFTNPKVSLYSYDLSSRTKMEIPRKDSQLGEENVVYEVFYVGEDDVLVKETDRESNVLNLRHFKPSTGESKVVHTVDANAEYQGWIEKFNAPLIIPKSESRSEWSYVDTYVVKGYNHLCYFESPTSKPRPLTSGDWEVVSGELAFDPVKELVYFSAAKSSVDKHLYSVHLTTGEIKAITDDSKPGYYDTSFSPNAQYASLFNQGPEIESMSIIRVEDQQLLMPYSQQKMYIEAKQKYAFPEHKFHRVDVDKYDDGSPVTLNIVEYLPQGFDPKKKYPLLVHFYAGPGSQVVKSSLGLDFEDVVSSSLDAIVLFIEPRGTAGQGWKFRSWANKNIGYWEPRDIVKVTKMWIEKGFIDKDRTACWGWSYGGFTTLKTLEYDAGETFKYGMAVAPVTNWLLYDSLYTERYMDKPENNRKGYEVSQIKDIQSLGRASRFLVMHGTADDNVHIQNTYGLLDLLTLKSVENYDVHVFPDSEHSIYFHNANPVVYDKLFSWLKDAFDGDFNNLGHK
jgi:dipeptidyl aminopeptidase/acylaminoacyl peptidase